MSFKGARGDEHMDYGGIRGLDGPRGEPGPYCARTELELVGHLIHEFEQAAGPGGTSFDMEDGRNHRTSVDGYAVLQTIRALRNYQALLRQPLHELVAPYFFYGPLG